MKKKRVNKKANTGTKALVWILLCAVVGLPLLYTNQSSGTKRRGGRHSGHSYRDSWRRRRHGGFFGINLGGYDPDPYDYDYYEDPFYRSYGYGRYRRGPRFGIGFGF